MSDTSPEVSNQDIYNLLQNVLSKNIEIQKEIKENKENISLEIKNLKEEFTNQFSEVKKQNLELKQENKELKIKLNAIERKTKKYNLVIYGLKEEPDHIEDFQKLLKVLNETLNITCNFSDFRDAFRIGSVIEGKIRPFAVEVINFHLKSEILANAKNLKGTGIFVSQDFTSEDYKKRKILYSNLKLARKGNLEANIKNNVLILDQEEFTVEDLERGTPHKILQTLQQQDSNLGKSGTDLEKSIREKVQEAKVVEEERNGTKRKQTDSQEEVKPKRSTRLNSNKN